MRSMFGVGFGLSSNVKEDECMSVSAAGNVNAASEKNYAAYAAAAPAQENAAADTAGKTESKEDDKASSGVVFEPSGKTEDTSKKATYSVNKMSSQERASLVQKLKADQENRQSQLQSMVQKMFSQQATTFANANDMWKFLAKGDFTVDAQTKLQAQQDISEDGYYGVKQTSERLFDFASALAGDDVDKMKEMQAAMEKGFKLATKAWGRDLPDISKQTLEAANKKFEEYYASKEKTEDAAKVE